MHIDGGCHCGAIAYTAEVNADNVIICHCSDCQTISGAPYPGECTGAGQQA